MIKKTLFHIGREESSYMSNIVIGIEGLVGAGKTSICRKLVHILPNTILLNGGNLYRAIVYAMMKNKDKLANINQDEDNIDIKEMMDFFNVELKIENKETVFYIDGILATEEELQSKDSSLAVSTIGGTADNSRLFKFAKDLIDNLKKNYNLLISGRSIMQIYPDTDYHFFITASLDERIKRKCIQYKGELEKEEVKQNIIKRDELQEKAGFYEISANTIEIDVTDCKTVEESTNKVLERIKIPSLYC